MGKVNQYIAQAKESLEKASSETLIDLSIVKSKVTQHCLNPAYFNEDDCQSIYQIMLVASEAEGESKQSAAINAIKLIAIFKTADQAIAYLKRFEASMPTSLKLVHSACDFDLPNGIWDMKLWQAIASHHKPTQPNDLVLRLLPAASEFEDFMREQRLKFKQELRSKIKAEFVSQFELEYKKNIKISENIQASIDEQLPLHIKSIMRDVKKTHEQFERERLGLPGRTPLTEEEANRLKIERASPESELRFKKLRDNYVASARDKIKLDLEASSQKVVSLSKEDYISKRLKESQRAINAIYKSKEASTIGDDGEVRKKKIEAHAVKVKALSDKANKHAADVGKLLEKSIKYRNLKLNDKITKLSSNADDLIAKVDSLSSNISSLDRVLPAFSDKITVENLTEYAEIFTYGDHPEYREIIKLFFKHRINKNLLHSASMLKPVDNNERIPDLVIDGADVSDQYKDYMIKKLSSSDPRALVLGKLTSNCQTIGDDGHFSVVNGVNNPDSGFYVLCRKKTDQILSQTWAWRGTDNNIVFDSIESDVSFQENNAMMISDMFMVLAHQLVQHHHAASVLVGKGGRTPINLKLLSPIHHSKATFRGSMRDFRDSLAQSIMADENIPCLLHYQKSNPANKISGLFTNELTKEILLSYFLFILKDRDNVELDAVSEGMAKELMPSAAAAAADPNEGAAVEGVAVEGAAVEGKADEGAAVVGVAVEGKADEGAAVVGVAVEGVAVEGAAVEGKAVEGAAVVGATVTESAGLKLFHLAGEWLEYLNNLQSGEAKLDRRLIEKFINSGIDPNYTYITNKTFYHRNTKYNAVVYLTLLDVAIINNNHDVAGFLIKSGADINLDKKLEGKFSYLTEALVFGDSHMLQILIAAGAKLTDRKEFHVDVVLEELNAWRVDKLAAPIVPPAVDNWGNKDIYEPTTTFEIAHSLEKNNMIAQLTAAFPQQTGLAIHRLLLDAIVKNDFVKFSRLIDLGAVLPEKFIYEGKQYHLLEFILSKVNSFMGSLGILEYFLENHANISYQNLIFVVNENKVECLTMLIKAGADVNNVPANEKPLLFYALKNVHHFDLVRILLQAGAKHDFTLPNGMTPLTYLRKEADNIAAKISASSFDFYNNMHVIEEKDAISKMIALFEEFDVRQQKLRSDVRVESQPSLASVSHLTMFKPALSGDVNVSTNPENLTTQTKKPTQ